jgi:threonine aldolase
MATKRYEIDLFSDNACRPTAGMRRMMVDAAVGDEEHGEDPTVRELEETVAQLTGKEDAVFTPSGTMANIVAYTVHCGPAGAVLIHEDSHPVYSGYGGPAVPGRSTLRLLPGNRGVVTSEEIERAVALTPRGRLLSLENTHNRSGGSVWPLASLHEACRTARAQGLATHLDGARLLNAVAATGTPVADYCRPFDSAWIDLSKGLGCPSGAVLAGSSEFVAAARRAKYLLGGVMHKAGMLAAAGLYALEHHVAGLQDDHARATELARCLAEVPGVELLQEKVETNIVYFGIGGTRLRAPELLSRLAPAGIRFKALSDSKLRAVTHLDIRDEHIGRVRDAVRAALAAA